MAIYRRSYLFRMEVEPVLRIWTGHGPLDTPADSIDPAGARWTGGAHLLDIPSLKLLLNGGADRIDIRVSGVDAYTLRLAQEDRAEVRDASVMIGFIDFDQAWQPTGPITWEWRGLADVMTVSSSGSAQGRERTITLSIRSGDTRRSNPRPAFFTFDDQHRRSPDDDIFSHVAQITAGVTRRFGPS